MKTKNALATVFGSIVFPPSISGMLLIFARKTIFFAETKFAQSVISRPAQRNGAINRMTVVHTLGYISEKSGPVPFPESLSAILSLCGTSSVE